MSRGPTGWCATRRNTRGGSRISGRPSSKEERMYRAERIVTAIVAAFLLLCPVVAHAQGAGATGEEPVCPPRARGAVARCRHRPSPGRAVLLFRNHVERQAVGDGAALRGRDRRRGTLSVAGDPGRVRRVDDRSGSDLAGCVADRPADGGDPENGGRPARSGRGSAGTLHRNRRPCLRHSRATAFARSWGCPDADRVRRRPVRCCRHTPRRRGDRDRSDERVASAMPAVAAWATPAGRF